MRKELREKTRRFALWLCLSAAGLISGCVTTGRPWGADATLRPGMARLREAARDAVSSPQAWIPLAGAAAFQINGWDRKVSKKTPYTESKMGS